jgi:Na+/proline symporter
MSLIGGHTMVEAAYEPTMWAKVFHSVPHVNITFHPVDPRFNPKNELYLESLGIIASVPAAWLITTLVVLLIYLCTRCCDTKSTKKRKSRPMRCCLSFFSLVTCASLAVGFLGNHILHEGIENFERSTRNINNVVDRSQAMAKRYNNVFNNDITKNLNRLYDGPFQRDIR